MKLNRFYKYIIWFLLILNIGMIVFFLLTKPLNLKGKHHRKSAIEILNLDENQNEQFLVYAKAHHKKMESINKQQKFLLDKYFQQIVKVDNNFDAENIMNQYQQLETDKIKISFLHFEQIKALLKSGQLSDFEMFMKNLTKHLLQEPKERRDFKRIN